MIAQNGFWMATVYIHDCPTRGFGDRWKDESHTMGLICGSSQKAYKKENFKDVLTDFSCGCFSVNDFVTLS